MAGRITMDIKQSKFEALVKAYSSDLYQYAYWLCRNQALAEDLVQESFMRAWKALNQLEDEKKAKSWLFTILRRENARHFSRKHTKDISLEEIDLDTFSNFKIENKELDHIHLRSALAKLSLEYSEPLVLQVLGGYSSKEIGDILEIKPGAVMTRLFRAKQQLKKLLKDTNSKSKQRSGTQS